MNRKDHPPMKRDSRRVFRERRGQFVVAAALLISILTLSIALSIHQLSLQRIQLRYEPVEELVMGLSSDLDRCLTYALHNATELYYNLTTSQTPLNPAQAYNESKKEVQRFLSKWVSSVIASHSPLGLKINMGTLDLFINWGTRKGQSTLSAYFFLDIESYGFKGWVGHSGKYVVLNITDEMWFSKSPEGSSITSIIFKIVQGKDEEIPIPNLTKEMVKVWVNQNRDRKILADILELRYLGMGLYNITFTPGMNKNTLGLTLLVKTTRDHIYVVAGLPYQDIYVTLRSQEESASEPTDLGQIQLGDLTYNLPNTTKVNPGNYRLNYTSVGPNYIFLNWTVTGDVNVTDSNSQLTVVNINGNGSITAFYSINPGTYTVRLESREVSGTEQNKGKITFDNEVYPKLPVNLSKPGGIYSLEFNPAGDGEQGQRHFLYWTTNGNIYINASNSNPTSVIINGDGTITAWYYKGKLENYLIYLKSRHLMNEGPENLGIINLQYKNYDLPNTLTISDSLPIDYSVRYIPHNSSYEFYCWESTGGVIPWNSTRIDTTITVTDNGTLTAVYLDFSESLPPIDEDWSTLYVDKGEALYPIFMVSGFSSHIPSWASTGLDKQEIILRSPSIPTNITLGRTITAILYLRPNPPKSGKSMDIELGYYYGDNNYTRIGNETDIPIYGEGIYYITFDSEVDEIPMGSVMVMNITMTFYVPPGGTFFLYYGPKDPSRIILYQR
jgi:hypothetical protein